MEQLINQTKCIDCKNVHDSYYPLLKKFLEQNASKSAILNISRDGELSIFLSGDYFINYKLDCDGCEDSEQRQVT